MGASQSTARPAPTPAPAPHYPRSPPRALAPDPAPPNSAPAAPLPAKVSHPHAPAPAPDMGPRDPATMPPEPDAASVASAATAATATTPATATTSNTAAAGSPARRPSSSRSSGHRRVSSAGMSFARLFRGSARSSFATGPRRSSGARTDDDDDDDDDDDGDLFGPDGELRRPTMTVQVIGREERAQKKLEAEYEEYNQTGLTPAEIRAQDRYTSVPERERPPDYIQMRDADRERRESRIARKSQKRDMREARKTEKLQRQGKITTPVVYEKGTVGFALNDAKRLGVLNLTKMDLSSIPDSVFDDLPGTTRVINVSSNDLVTIDPRFTEFVLVQRLVANANRISSVPSIISRMTALRKLDLASNLLTTVPDSFANMPHLEHVDLSYNLLETLPESFVSLNLVTLRLSGNKFTAPPTVIDGVSSLKELYLDRNNLSSVPASWSKLSNLGWLVLDSNNLSDFPNEILAHCNKLEALSVRSNPLTLATLESKPNWGEYESRCLGLHMHRVHSGLVTIEDLRLNELRVTDE